MTMQSEKGRMSFLSDDQWLRIDQVRELVKQEGDWRCEASFDDLSTEILGQRARVKGLVDSMKRYGRHESYCGAFGVSHPVPWREQDVETCTCGFAAALLFQILPTTV